MNMFNSNGKMDAHSLKDALETLVKYAKIMEEGIEHHMAEANKQMPEEDMEQLLNRAVNAQQVRSGLPMFDGEIDLSHFVMTVKQPVVSEQHFERLDNPSVKIVGE